MPWISTMTTNAGIALAAGLLILCMGFTTFVIVHVPIVVLGRDDGRLAVLRAASIRGDDMGRGDGLEPA